jgi:hypothetical protein
MTKVYGKHGKVLWNRINQVPQAGLKFEHIVLSIDMSVYDSLFEQTEASRSCKLQGKSAPCIII